jgi:hypothetical protein
MKKIDSALFVCTSEQAQQLIELGIMPAAFFCFELQTGVPEGGNGEVEQWEFAGEYFDQEPAIPAWTKEEICIMIGGYFVKPDMPDNQEWTANRNMLHYLLHFPDSSKAYRNGAQACAAYLIFLLQHDHITAAQANERLEAFMQGIHYNPIESENFKPKKK